MKNTGVTTVYYRNSGGTEFAPFLDQLSFVPAVKFVLHRGKIAFDCPNGKDKLVCDILHSQVVNVKVQALFFPL